MKLFYSTASPYVRKVLIVLHELGLEGEVERIPAIVSPVKREMNVARHNPAGHIPTLMLDDGQAIFDSRVICEYLDSLGNSAILHPANLKERIEAQCLQALADAVLDAAVLVRFETALRPTQYQWSDWIDGQWGKVTTSLAALELKWMAHLQSRFDIGVIAAACALGYLDFRFPDKPWRSQYPGLAKWFEKFAQRPSMVENPHAPMV